MPPRCKAFGCRDYWKIHRPPALDLHLFFPYISPITDAAPQQILAYLRDCLAEERSRSGILSIHASKIRSRRIMTGEEKAAFCEFASIDLFPSEIAPLVSTASLLQRDTQLYYGVIFIAAMDQGRPVHTPVILYPVEVNSEGEIPQLLPDHSRVTLNPALSTLFDLPHDFENQLLDIIPTGVLNLASPGLIAACLAAHIPNLDTRPFAGFPKLLSPSQLNPYPGNESPTLLPASALILAEKSKNVAGLLHELDRIRSHSTASFPPALLAMFGASISTSAGVPRLPDSDFAPAFLNPSQKQILRSAAANPLTVCHGPPGTGKSYTIAATALDHVARSQSVLIACRSDEAAAVIEQKIAGLMPGSQLVIRAGRRQHLSELKTRLDQLLGSHVAEPENPSVSASHLKRIDRRLAASLARLKKRFNAGFANGHLFESPPQTLLAKINRWWHHRRVMGSPLLLESVREIDRLFHKRVDTLRGFNAGSHRQRLHKHLRSPHSLRVLKRYREILGRRAPASQERELLELDLKTLLHFFPVWITTTDDVHRVLPLKSGTFDLVIIDEATQIDLAAALPVLYRGKRAFITGDPQQLRHISFLSTSKIQSLAEKHNLSPQNADDFDFRRRSFLDRAIQISADRGALTFLNEHFRSLPRIIGFSNLHFYQNGLHCMREVETLHHRETHAAFTLHGVRGRRDPGGVNHAEIDAALSVLQFVLSHEGESTAPPSSLGFLSPFRAQVDAFLTRFQGVLSPSEQQRLLRDHQLIAGTAHSFQGAQRDIMLLSFAIDPASTSAARRFLERPDVFNVSITRARHHVHLFHSIETCELPHDSLLGRYLLHASDTTAETRRFPKPKSIGTPGDLLPSLAAAGWEVIATDTSIAGMPIDILLCKDGRHLALDLIGTTGDPGHAVSIEKNLLLQRAGLTLVPVSLAEWITQRDAVLAGLTSHSEVTLF